MDIRKMKPMTVTILVTTILCIAITSVFLAITFTIGETENKDDFVAHEDSDFEGSIFEEVEDTEENDKTGKEIGRRVVCGVFLSTFGILGIIGNILSIIVFTRPSMRTGSYLIFCGKW